MSRQSATLDVLLAWPIEVAGGAEIARLTLRRPKGRTIKKLIALIGPDTIAAVLGDADGGSGALADRVRQRLMQELAGFATEEKLDALTTIIAELAGQTPAIIDEVDLADYPAIFSALAGFFPDLFSAGDPSPPT